MRSRCRSVCFFFSCCYVTLLLNLLQRCYSNVTETKKPYIHNKSTDVTFDLLIVTKTVWQRCNFLGCKFDFFSPIILRSVCILATFRVFSVCVCVGWWTWSPRFANQGRSYNPDRCDVAAFCNTKKIDEYSHCFV